MKNVAAFLKLNFYCEDLSKTFSSYKIKIRITNAVQDKWNLAELNERGNL